jgi:hypothetical protein
LNPLVRIADKAHPPRRQIRQPLMIVKQLASRRQIQGVDGKIAPRRIRPPIGAKAHNGMAAIGGHILAQGGNFNGGVIATGR